MDDSGSPHAGLLTGDDLAGWRATWEPAVTLDWRGLTVAKPAAWSQGPVLLQQLALLGDGDLPARGQRRADPPGGRGSQAGVRRPGGVLRRRPGRAAGRPALAGVHRRAPGADRRRGGRRSAAGLAGRAHAGAAAARTGPRGADCSAAGTGGAEPGRARPRRHLPRRRGRPVGDDGVRDPVRRLAAERADDPGARLLPRHPRGR